jgi:hypothetical protein
MAARVLVLVILLVLLACLAMAQDEPMQIEVVKQPGCPLKMEVVTTTTRAGVSSSQLRFKNEIEKKARVLAYTIFYENAGESWIKTTIAPTEASTLRGIDPPSPRLRGKVLLSFDHVRFTDGTRCGLDAFHKAEDITQWLRGHQVAKDRLAELMFNNLQWVYSKAQERTGLHEEEPANPGPLLKEKKNYWDLGYEMTVKAIPSTEESRVYIPKLLAMPRGRP